MAELKQVTIYTDGACLGNPGPGGYGVILISGGVSKELSAGYRLTTNNRMELMAVIAGLQALKTRCAVTVYSDSQYVVDGVTKGWAVRWRANGWMRSANSKAVNADLWERLLQLCEQHQVTLEWIRGHAGHPENERCDRLSVAAASGKSLVEDTGYIPAEARQAQDATTQVLGKPDNRVKEVRTDRQYVYLSFRDFRELRAPLTWFPKLYAATRDERVGYELRNDGRAIYFPSLGVTLNIEYLLGFPDSELTSGPEGGPES